MLHDGHILIIDDDQDILTAGKLLLKRHFQQVTLCNRPQQIPTLLEQHNIDAILLDMNFGPGESSGEQGFSWLKTILDINPQIAVVMITAHGGVDLAVEAMKLGAVDFVAKPWQNEKLVATLRAAVLLAKSRDEASRLRDTNQLLTQTGNRQHQQLIGQSSAMQHVMSLVARAAPTDANVLILGENGTGKELIAREIHYQSQRADKLFMAVDLGAVAENLFESELFGHKKGAFTGADQDRVGRLLAADGGTLFLDEIGNLPLHLQAKLLTVLEQRQVTPLGSNKAQPFDVRVISATNVPRSELVDETRFRQDLLFRLNTVEITLPALRHRRDDILSIAEFYLAHYQRKYQKPGASLSPEARQAIEAYDWPGNVRALRHAVERAVILSQQDALTADDFQLSPAVSPTAATPSAGALPELELNLEKLEKLAIETALKQHRYNISHAAQTLGLTRAALYRRMEKHGL